MMMVRENHHHFLIITVRVWINPRGKKLPTDEFGTGLIEKLVSRGALRHPCRAKN